MNRLIHSAAGALLAVACLPALTLGQATAIIQGPDTSKAGNLVVLSSLDSEGEATRWIIPKQLDGRYITTEGQLAFAVRESGKFTFHLVAVACVADAEPDIAVDSHTVQITDGFGEPAPPDPGEPGEPGEPPEQPTPAPDLEALRDLSREKAVAVDDPPTAKALANALRNVSIQPLEQMRANVSERVEGVLLNRSGDSQNKDWLSGWRKPVSKAITAESPERYREELRAVAAGLDAAAGVEPPEDDDDPRKVHRVTMLTRDNCGWCTRWKSEVKPKLIEAGWEVDEKQHSGPVPQFDVVVGTKTTRLTGYTDASTFAQFMQDLRNAHDMLRQ